MKSIQKLVSIVALVVMILACLLFFYDVVTIDVMKWIVLGSTVAWFATAPLWIGNRSKIIDDQVEI